MTQRTILAGANPNIIIKVGANVTVTGREGDVVTAETEGGWGLKVERTKDTIEVQMGGSGRVSVPVLSNLKVYAGKDIEVQNIQGQVDAFSGFSLSLREVYCLGNVSSGWRMALDCQTMSGDRVEFKAGGDLRFHVRDLTSVRLRVKDLGGFWEAQIGTGQKSVSLKSGGDVIIVTDQEVNPLPPHYILGKIEKPVNLAEPV